ncbi:MAG: RluA family pseudouridine synthase, partial [Flavobacteriaceae bacterium]|nr:RluA family pseudouridine synthase [Flavobacteriaceae bacterium]
KKLINVNGKLATTGTLIFGGEVIEFHNEMITKNTKEFIFKLDVVFEDDFIALINKPAGILVSGNSFKTIANALVSNLKASNQPDAVSPQPAHRLDYPTTGLLLIGKTSKSIRDLNNQFKNKEIHKTYFSAAIGSMKKDGVITYPIDGKESISEFEVLKTVPSKRFKYLNLVKLTPKTGRRHQLRKHLSELGNPILGDREYGIESLILKGKGLYLHAYSIDFTHPFTKEKMVFQQELPSKFSKMFGD